jgi:hypothetical protein
VQPFLQTFDEEFGLPGITRVEARIVIRRPKLSIRARLHDWLALTESAHFAPTRAKRKRIVARADQMCQRHDPVPAAEPDSR